MVCPLSAGQEGGGEAAWTFCGHVGVKFLRFCADIFYGRSLSSYYNGVLID